MPSHGPTVVTIAPQFSFDYKQILGLLVQCHLKCKSGFVYFKEREEHQLAASFMFPTGDQARKRDLNLQPLSAWDAIATEGHLHQKATSSIQTRHDS